MVFLDQIILKAVTVTVELQNSPKRFKNEPDHGVSQVQHQLTYFWPPGSEGFFCCACALSGWQAVFCSGNYTASCYYLLYWKHITKSMSKHILFKSEPTLRTVVCKSNSAQVPNSTHLSVNSFNRADICVCVKAMETQNAHNRKFSMK